jgi:hypothetical protein
MIIQAKKLLDYEELIIKIETKKRDLKTIK